MFIKWAFGPLLLVESQDFILFGKHYAYNSP